MSKWETLSSDSKVDLMDKAQQFQSMLVETLSAGNTQGLDCTTVFVSRFNRIQSVYCGTWKCWPVWYQSYCRTGYYSSRTSICHQFGCWYVWSSWWLFLHYGFVCGWWQSSNRSDWPSCFLCCWIWYKLCCCLLSLGQDSWYI